MLLNTKTLLPAYFLPPVSWFAPAAEIGCIRVGTAGHYAKQTYFNRCLIKGPNGVQRLTAPVLHPGTTELKNIRLSYAEPWPRLHCRALTAAYSKSPYYEHYMPDVEKVLLAEEPNLLVLNMSLLTLLAQWLELPLEVKPQPPDLISSKTDLSRADISKPYYQLFGPFVGNLSILDLLFNMGPEAIEVLQGDVLN